MGQQGDCRGAMVDTRKELLLRRESKWMTDIRWTAEHRERLTKNQRYLERQGQRQRHNERECKEDVVT